MAIDEGWELEWANLSLLKKRLEHAKPIEVERNKSYQVVLEVEGSGCWAGFWKLKSGENRRRFAAGQPGAAVPT